jgi:hypothetical protein
MDKERPDEREAFEPLEIEVIAFEQEDVITTSGDKGNVPPVGGQG